MTFAVYPQTVFPVGVNGLADEHRESRFREACSVSAERRWAAAMRLSTACVQLGQLAHGDCSLQFAHPVVQREKVVVRLRVAVSPAFVDEQEKAARQTVIVGCDQAAFAGRDVLALLQTEAAYFADRSRRNGPDVAPGTPERNLRSLVFRASPRGP